MKWDSLWEVKEEVFRKRLQTLAEQLAAHETRDIVQRSRLAGVSL